MYQHTNLTLHQRPSWSFFPSSLTCASILPPSAIGSHSCGPEPRFCRAGLWALWAAQHPQGPNYSTNTAMSHWDLEGDLQTQQGCARHQWFWSQHRTDNCTSDNFSFKTAARQSWQLSFPSIQPNKSLLLFMKLKANTEVVLYKLPSKFLPLFNSQRNLAHTGRVWSFGITVLQAAVYACVSKPDRHKPWAPLSLGKRLLLLRAEHYPGLSRAQAQKGAGGWMNLIQNCSKRRQAQVNTQDSTAVTGSYSKEQ